MGHGIELPKVNYPDDMPFSGWEGHAARLLLQANGFGDTRDAWHQGAESPLALIRSTALLLLSQPPEQIDRARFEKGTRDRFDSVRVWAAYGLVRLGDTEAHRILEDLRSKQVADGEHAPLVASRLLAQLGEAAAFVIILKAAPVLPDFAAILRNLMPFVALEGQAYAPNATVDVWPLYQRALASGDSRIETIALAQLEELGNPASAHLLRTYLKRQPSPPLLRRAERVLQRVTHP